MLQEDHDAFRLEQQYADTHTDLPARVFFGAGALESEILLTNMRKMVATLDGRRYPQLLIDSRFFEEQTHVSVAATTISRGLRSIYA